MNTILNIYFLINGKQNKRKIIKERMKTNGKGEGKRGKRAKHRQRRETDRDLVFSKLPRDSLLVRNFNSESERERE